MIAGFGPPREVVAEAARTDAALLAEIHGACFSHGWSEDDFAVLLAQDTVGALILRRDGFMARDVPAGFILVRRAADEAEILTLAVLPDWRGRGVGRRLAEEALRGLYRDGARRVFLEVDAGNEAALHLYRSLGFEEVGRRHGYYEEAGEQRTALVMRAQLR